MGKRRQQRTDGRTERDRERKAAVGKQRTDGLAVKDSILAAVQCLSDVATHLQFQVLMCHSCLLPSVHSATFLPSVCSVTASDFHCAAAALAFPLSHEPTTVRDHHYYYYFSPPPPRPATIASEIA